MDKTRILGWLAILVWLCLLPLRVGAQDIVTLDISRSSEGVKTPIVTLGLGDLQAMPETTIRTSTVWTEDVQEFTGVSLRDLLGTLNVTSGSLKAKALNDYLVEIPVSDASEDGPIIAYARNGKLMSVRDKGPLWIIYPYDSHPKYRREEIYIRSIWQLNRIVIIP